MAATIRDGHELARLALAGASKRPGEHVELLECSSPFADGFAIEARYTDRGKLLGSHTVHFDPMRMRNFYDELHATLRYLIAVVMPPAGPKQRIQRPQRYRVTVGPAKKKEAGE